PLPGPKLLRQARTPLSGPNVPLPGPNVPLPGPNVPLPGPKLPLPSPKLPPPGPKLPLPGPNVPPGQRRRGDCNFNGVTPEKRGDTVTDVTYEQIPARVAGTDTDLVRELAERARAEGLQLTGEGGLLGRLTKIVVEGALEGE